MSIQFLIPAIIPPELPEPEDFFPGRGCMVVGREIVRRGAGASRSGTTITAGLFLGMKRDDAARFSFLLSIPAVFGSGILEFYGSLKYLGSADYAALAVSTLAAAISGYLSIAFLLKFLKTNSTMIFIIYRMLIGSAILAALFFNVI